MKFKIDNFVLAIIATILLAYFFPQWGGAKAILPLDKIGSIGISLIFFFYGLKLTPQKIKNGLKNVRLHIVVQLTTFLIFPLVVLIFYPFFCNSNQRLLWLSFLFLAALPSTVSSSVVMVSLAGGNVPAAIFNASISGLIGILITPLWMGFFLVSTTTDFHLGEIYFKLIVEILLPILFGLALHRYLYPLVHKYINYLTLFDKSVILLIIFKGFASAFEQNLFNTVGLHDILFIALATITLFFLIYYITGFITKKLHFNQPDTITARFCGTKKSLVHGTVFSKILFPPTFPMALLLLPLMLFHALQILFISIIATRYAQKSTLEPTNPQIEQLDKEF